MEPIRVVIADDHFIVRYGIRRFLERDPEICVVGEAWNNAEALAMVTELKPDVLLLDLDMPLGKSLDLIPTLNNFPVRVIVLSSYDDECYSIEMLHQPCVRAYLSKEDVPSLLVTTVRSVIQDGWSHLSPWIDKKDFQSN